MSDVEAFFDGGYVARGIAIGAVLFLLLATALGAPRRGARPWLGALLSLGAVLGMYACTPDTELSRQAAGGVVGAAAVATAGRWSWARTADVITVVLVVVAISDGRPRTSAIVGGLAIAAVHHLAQRQVHLSPLVVALAGGATLVCSRVAGTAESTSTSIAVVAAVAVAAAGAVCLDRARASRCVREGPLGPAERHRDHQTAQGQLKKTSAPPPPVHVSWPPAPSMKFGPRSPIRVSSPWPPLTFSMR